MHKGERIPGASRSYSNEWPKSMVLGIIDGGGLEVRRF